MKQELLFYLGIFLSSIAVLLIVFIGFIWRLECKFSKIPRCPKCGCEVLSSLRSINVKKCTSCSHEIEWNLDPGQLPLVRSNRMVKRNEP